MSEIRNRYNNQIIIKEDNKSIKELIQIAIQKKIDLIEADLIEANLIEANLTMADLRWANLTRADLRWAYLTRTDLRWADLTEANLTEANLTRADLRWANLTRADLRWAYLTRADLTEANLTEANLTRADHLEFQQFPSIRTLSSIKLKNISDKTILELMRLDASAHPYPELFDQWAEGGNCPYQNEERWWYMPERREIWKPGKPTMKLSDLIIQICREEGWGIRDILKINKKGE